MDATKKNINIISIGVTAIKTVEPLNVHVDFVQQMGSSTGRAFFLMADLNTQIKKWNNPHAYLAVNYASGGKSAKEHYYPIHSTIDSRRQSSPITPNINIFEWGFGTYFNPIKNQPLEMELSLFGIGSATNKGGIFSGQKPLYLGVSDNTDLGYLIRVKSQYHYKSLDSILSLRYSIHKRGDAHRDIIDVPDDVQYVYLGIEKRF